MSISELKKNMGEGDVVVLWAGREAVKPITLQKGEIFQNKWGVFRHDDMIGKPYGVKVRTSVAFMMIDQIHQRQRLVVCFVSHSRDLGKGIKSSHSDSLHCRY